MLTLLGTHRSYQSRRKALYGCLRECRRVASAYPPSASKGLSCQVMSGVVTIGVTTISENGCCQVVTSDNRVTEGDYLGNYILGDYLGSPAITFATHRRAPPSHRQALPRCEMGGGVPSGAGNELRLRTRRRPAVVSSSVLLRLDLRPPVAPRRHRN